MKHIIGCLDGSIYTPSVCDHALWLAQRLGGDIELLHVLDHHREHASVANFSGAIGFRSNEALMEQLTEVQEARARVGLAKGRAILQEGAKRLRDAGAAVITTQLHGSLVETLTARETRDSVVVLGKRGEAADFAKLHLGANLERVARASICPILAAARAFRPIERVLIAHDGGASIRKAMGFLAQSPLLRGLHVQILAVGAPDQARRTQLEDAKSQTERCGAIVTTRTEPGDPETTIARITEQEGFDLLVIGAYGHSRIRSLVIGSTTTAMLRACRIPVLMVR
ncbi:MAG: universal stress protein [Acidiphilium sp.]|nr:universal stress protein [Acidiphilium sp.]